MQLHKSINLLIILCQTVGLVAFSRNKKLKKWKKNRCSEFVTLSLVAIIVTNFLLCLIFSHFLVDESESSLQAAIIIYSVLLIYLHVFAILSEHFWKRSKQIKLLNLFLKLESMAKSHKGFQLDYRGIRRISHYSILFWALQTFGLLSFNVIILTKSKDIYDLFFLSSYIVPFVLSKLSYIYSMNLITILHKNMSALIKYTASFNDNTPNLERENPTISFHLETIDRHFRRFRRNGIDANTISFVKRFYALIWKASVTINGIFYWSWSIGLINESSILVFNCFFFIMSVASTSETQILPNLYLFSWTILHIMNIMLVTFTCGNAAQTVTGTNLTVFVNFDGFFLHFQFRLKNYGYPFLILTQPVLIAVLK